MRLALVDGRSTLVTALDGDLVPVAGVDVETLSDGRFGHELQPIFERWAEFRGWVGDIEPPEDGKPIARESLGAPVGTPRQIFAIGLNYRAHAEEAQAGAQVTVPPTFTKFVTCLTGPFAEVVLPSENVDWEVELVAVIGVGGHRIAARDAWAHVAGLAVGQDLSERVVQMVRPLPQFSLGKSYPGFGPIGPALVTSDELDEPDRLTLECSVDGEVRQRSDTSAMILSVSGLVERLSAVTPLLPGDVIFTGTPEGVGMARQPVLYLKPGEVLETRIAGVGMLRNEMLAL